MHITWLLGPSVLVTSLGNKAIQIHITWLLGPSVLVTSLGNKAIEIVEHFSKNKHKVRKY